MSAGRTDSGLYLVKFSNGYVRAKIPRNALKLRGFPCRGIHAPPVSVKAHTAPHVGKHGLQLRRETFGLHRVTIFVKCRAITLLTVLVHLFENYFFLSLR